MNGNVVPGCYKQTVIPNEDPDDKKVNIKLDYQSNVGISESAWLVNAHEIFWSGYNIIHSYASSYLSAYWTSMVL